MKRIEKLLAEVNQDNWSNCMNQETNTAERNTRVCKGPKILKNGMLIKLVPNKN
jgi:hypothetical protein